MKPQSNHLQWLARIGYAARGLVFVILGYFTALAAISAQRPVDNKDALRTLLDQPFGGILLGAIAAGLFCFAIWREAQCFADADGCGSDAKGLMRRMIFGAAGLFYAAFASIVVSMLVGARAAAGETERSVHDWSGWLLTKPMGRWVLAAVGIAIVVSGIGIGITGLKAEFKQRLGMTEKPRWFVTALGCAGYLTRATVFAIIGIFLVFAAIDANAHEATGLAGALDTIKRQPFGPALLGITAAGFVAFGAYGLAEAVFRRIDGKYLTTGQPSWLRV